jgi:hypothetical protein
MKIQTIPDLLASDPETNEEARLLREALRQWLDFDFPARGGRNQPPLQEWRDARKQEIASFEDKHPHWTRVSTSKGEATRRDCVTLTNGGWDPSYRVADVAIPMAWRVQFPSDGGRAYPYRIIQASTLLDAMDQVDAKWPIASWWTEFLAEEGGTRQWGGQLGR